METVQQSVRVEYEGGDTIELQTFIKTQQNLLGLVSDIQAKLEPDAKLSLRLGSPEKGSVLIDWVMVIGWAKSLLTVDTIKTGAVIIQALGGVLAIHKHLKGEKPKVAAPTADGGMVITASDNAVVTVDRRVYQYYVTTPSAAKAISKMFQELDEASGVTGFKMTDEKSPESGPIVDVPRAEFKEMVHSSPFAKKEDSDDLKTNQILFIKKPNLLPEDGKRWTWEFIYRDRPIEAEIVDQELRTKINNGQRLGQGDRLLADVRVYYAMDKQLAAKVETGRIVVEKVHEVRHKPDDPQTAMDMD